jgi:hypothetical protein
LTENASAPFRWRIEVFSAAAPKRDPVALRGQVREHENLPLDDIDLTEFERRYVERAHGTPASFRGFRELWEGVENRRSLTPQAWIAPERDAFLGDSALRLAVVWTLGPADPGERARGDVMLEFLLDMGATLLLFGMWRRIVAHVADLLRPGLHVSRTFQPSDAGEIRSLFAMQERQGKKGTEGAERMEDAGRGGVCLNPEGTIVPAKSRCAFITLSGAPEATPAPLRCSGCGPKGCDFGRMGLCPAELF